MRKRVGVRARTHANRRANVPELDQCAAGADRADTLIIPDTHTPELVIDALTPKVTLLVGVGVAVCVQLGVTLGVAVLLGVPVGAVTV